MSYIWSAEWSISTRCLKLKLKFMAGHDLWHQLGFLPKFWLLQVLPDKTVAVLMYLAPHHKASRSARGVPSSLKLDFTVHESAAAADPVEQISDSQSAPSVSLPAPPPSPVQVDPRPDAGSGHRCPG